MYRRNEKPHSKIYEKFVPLVWNSFKLWTCFCHAFVQTDRWTEATCVTGSRQVWIENKKYIFPQTWVTNMPTYCSAICALICATFSFNQPRFEIKRASTSEGRFGSPVKKHKAAIKYDNFVRTVLSTSPPLPSLTDDLSRLSTQSSTDWLQTLCRIMKLCLRLSNFFAQTGNTTISGLPFTSVSKRVLVRSLSYGN